MGCHPTATVPLILLAIPLPAAPCSFFALCFSSLSIPHRPCPSRVAQLKDVLLPVESHTARFQMVTPKMWDTVPRGSSHAPGSAEALAARRPVVVLLAGTGEHGYTRRRLFISYSLARRGVASLVRRSLVRCCGLCVLAGVDLTHHDVVPLTDT